MNNRRVTSLTALISFLLMLLTSIILYIVPQGRVAYWSDWRLWGLSKTQWGDLHINLGVLFLGAISLHIYYNWKPILTYLKNRARQMVVITREFNVSLGITLMVVLGTYFMVPPFSSILNISGNIKDTAALKYGEPPFGHAELAPLASLAKKTGLDPAAAMDKLEAAGIRFDSPQAITLEVAKANKITPKALYGIMTAGNPPAGPAGLPELPPPGSGNKTLSRLCEEYDLDPDAMAAAFEQQGLPMDRDRTLKDLARENRISPIELYDKIRAAGKQTLR